jgi:hypothetical protein
MAAKFKQQAFPETLTFKAACGGTPDDHVRRGDARETPPTKVDASGKSVRSRSANDRSEESPGFDECAHQGGLALRSKP